MRRLQVWCKLYVISICFEFFLEEVEHLNQNKKLVYFHLIFLLSIAMNILAQYIYKNIKCIFPILWILNDNLGNIYILLCDVWQDVMLTWYNINFICIIICLYVHQLKTLNDSLHIKSKMHQIILFDYT